MWRWVILGVLMVVSSQNRAASSESAANKDLCLWYTQPAKIWEEALPIGNGRMGAMVFGRIAEERIQFNEDTLWRGRPHDYVREGAADVLTSIRALLFDGKHEEAAEIVRSRFLSDPVRQMPYQPFGDLHFIFDGHEPAEGYRRELDLNSAIARTEYQAGDVIYTREVFASHPDQVIVIHLTASKSGRLSFRLRMDSPHEQFQSFVISEDTLGLRGKVQADGVSFESRLCSRVRGGKLIITDSGIDVRNADSATLLLAAHTSVINFEDISADPAERCEATLAKLGDKDVARIRQDHIADYQHLFHRMHLNLGRTKLADLPTDQRLSRIAADASKGDDILSGQEPTAGLAADPAFAMLYFQFGRYLLIASSRPGSQPANLQGVWNELMDPPWDSKFTLNINFQMNYWPAELTNLAELHQPFFDLVDDLQITGGRTARKQYGARGWVVHHNTDMWRGSAPINNIEGVWPTGSAWLCHHMWEHYLFSRDRRFLRDRAYPAMKEASLFFLDFLIVDPRTGWLVTNPSHSPEQGPLTYGPTMDSQLIRALFNYTIEAAEELNSDAELVKRLQAARDQLPPNQVGKHGQLQEWIEDVDTPDNKHRHMSPLWGLYPGWDITPDDPEIFKAAKVLLTWRGDGSTGWSYAWRIPLWGRAGDGAMAYRQLSLQLARRTFPNLFDKCGPFQVDGNFGATGGLVELFLQSHMRTSEGVVIIDLLPALPPAWQSGTITGLRARDGFEIDMQWNEGRLVQVTLRSTTGFPCRVRLGDRVVDLHPAAGKTIQLDGMLQPITASGRNEP